MQIPRESHGRALDELCAGLTQAERQQLIALLSRVAAQQGLPTGVHPGVVDTNAEDKT